MRLEGKEASRALNKLARLKVKENLLKDIVIDFMVCDIEGFSKKQYVKELKDFIDDIYSKFKK